MRSFQLCGLNVLVSAAMLLSGKKADAQTQTPLSHVVLRVEEVSVLDTKPGGAPWDVKPPPTSSNCWVLPTVGAMFGFAPAGAAAGSLCRALEKQKNKNPNFQLPDLQVRIKAGLSHFYASEVFFDTSFADFSDRAQRFVVPLAVLDKEDLKLRVIDVDDSDAEELLGTFTISRAKLLAAINTEGKRIELASDSVKKLLLHVSAYENSPPVKLSFDTKLGVSPTKLSIISGEVLWLHASGKYQPWVGWSPLLGPEGFTPAPNENVIPSIQAIQDAPARFVAVGTRPAASCLRGEGQPLPTPSSAPAGPVARGEGVPDRHKVER